jgi:hypothetical protein
LSKESEHPFRNRLIEDIVVERVKELLAVGFTVEKIQDLLLHPVRHKRRFGSATSRRRRRGGLALVFHQMHRATIHSNPLEIVTLRISPINESNGS